MNGEITGRRIEQLNEEVIRGALDREVMHGLKHCGMRDMEIPLSPEPGFCEMKSLEIPQQIWIEYSAEQQRRECINQKTT